MSERNLPPQIAYLQALAASFWRWSAQGQEIEWADGRTIAFKSEVEALVRRLANDGLPPLGALVLLLAACRNNWPDPPSRRGLLAGVLDAERSPESRTLLWQVCDGLDRVQALPGDLRHALDAKAELAALVFEDCPQRLNRALSERVVQALAENTPFEAGRTWSADTQAYLLTRDLSALRNGLARVTPEAVRLRWQTSLEALPQPAPLPPPPPATGRAWLKELEADDELAGLARLALRLLAVIHVPRYLHQPDELPLGGVSDIAPRGSLDRLLLSELAHDDLTLAVRVAMNEALYLRRESPPRTPPRQRRLVLDAGLRLWGLPRIYATAVALAFNAQEERNVTLLNYRAAGPELTPISLNTADGIREHLAVLDHRLHPGEALPALNALAEESADAECLLVTSAETLADRAFQTALDQHRRGTLYLALVARDGRFEFVQCSRSGRKRLSQAQFSLEELFAPRPHAAQLQRDDRAPLPAYFRCAKPPLLLPVERRLENSWHVPTWGVFTVTGDRRLLLSKSAHRGAEQLADDLRPGMIRGVAPCAPHADQVCLVVGKLSQRGLEAIWVDRSSGGISRVPLRPDAGEVDGVTVDRDVAYVRTTKQIQALDLRTGQTFHACARQSDFRFFGNYVTSVKHQGPSQRFWFWSRLGVEGSKTVLVPLAPALHALQEPWLRVFEAVGEEGPIAITAAGNLCRVGSDETVNVLHELSGRLNVESVSRDGAEFVLSQGQVRVLVRTRDGAVTQRAVHEVDLETELRPLVPARVVRRRFDGVGVDGDGCLVLISAKGAAWTLTLPGLTFPQQSLRAVPESWQTFEHWEHEDAPGLRLHRATFADGSQAVLDGRGLLHLRSAETSIPECTLVLCEGATAGWCSNGLMWGDPYYCGERATMKAEMIAGEVIQPFLERLS